MSIRDSTTAGTRPYVIAVVVLGVLVLGLGGWVVYDLFFSPTGAPSAELDQLVADYEAAWMDADAAAFEALVTDDYTFESGASSWSVGSMRSGIAVDDGFRVETPSEAWSGDGPRYHVALVETIFSDYGAPGPFGQEGISVLEIVEVDDGYLIARHVWFTTEINSVR